MTQTRTYLAFAALVLAFGGLSALLLPSQAAPAQAAAPALVSAPDFHRIDAIPAVQAAELPRVDPLIARTLAAHVGDTGSYTTLQSIEAHLAADRVCEGMVDGVPLMEIADVVAEQQGLTDNEAHDFVLIAHEVQCPTF